MNGVTSTHVEDFINPKSMPTPAAAGAIVALIAGALFKTFGLSVAFVTIILSLIVGMIVFHSREFKMSQWSWITKSAVYIINSLIIFAMATGTTAVVAADSIVQKRPYFYDWTTKSSIDDGKPYYETTDGNSHSVPFDFSVKVEPKDHGGLKGFLSEYGIVQQDYSLMIKLVEKQNLTLEDIDNVKIILPETYFSTHEFVLSADQAKNGLIIQAWTGFPVAAEITTKTGQMEKIFQIIDPIQLMTDVNDAPSVPEF